MPKKKLKLTRKEFQAELPSAGQVVFIQGDARAPEGWVGVQMEVGKACYLTLFEQSHLQEMCRMVEFQPAAFRINKMDPAELFVQLVRYVQNIGFGASFLIIMI